MMRRCPSILAAIAVALLLASHPTPAGADRIASVNYTMTAQGGLPAADLNATSPQVVATVKPPGGIVPPPSTDGKAEESPLTILDDSAGFDQKGLLVLLRDNSDKKDEPLKQEFGLSFFGTGLLPASEGGKLHFALSVDKALESTPPMFDAPAGISILPDTMPTATPPVTTADATPPEATPTVPVTPTLDTPEPMSLVLWSAMAGLGLWRVRRSRS